MESLVQRIFTVGGSTFAEVALQVFRYQFQHVSIYRQFCQAFQKTPETVQTLADIPFLPIEFFKGHTVLSDECTGEKIFESSGTTGSIPSKHYVASLALYERSFLECFRRFYGPPEEYAVIALLPSYLERDNSSLVYMVNKLIELSAQPESGFMLHAGNRLQQVLQQLSQKGTKTLLLGVTFALLDFAEHYGVNFPGLIVMETGGMKGRRAEITRQELHHILCPAFGVSAIHSEYGMTELLSQAYSPGGGVFKTPGWMRITGRDMYEPARLLPRGETGALNVIDLANLYSCAFIATGDMGRVGEKGNFEVLGRMDNAGLRGCNLMYV